MGSWGFAVGTDSEINYCNRVGRFQRGVCGMSYRKSPSGVFGPLMGLRGRQGSHFSSPLSSRCSELCCVFRHFSSMLRVPFASIFLGRGVARSEEKNYTVSRLQLKLVVSRSESCRSTTVRRSPFGSARRYGVHELYHSGTLET